MLARKRHLKEGLKTRSSEMYQSNARNWAQVGHRAHPWYFSQKHNLGLLQEDQQANLSGEHCTKQLVATLQNAWVKKRQKR